MKSRISRQLRSAIGLGLIVVMATACAGTKAKVAASGATPAGATDSSSAAAEASHAGQATAPIKPTGGGNFCKMLATSMNNQRVLASGSTTDGKTQIDAAQAAAHQALKLAPSTIKSDVALLVTASDSMYSALARAGYDYSKLTAADMSSLSAPAIATAEEHLTAYVKDTCGIDLGSVAAVSAAASNADGPATAAADPGAGADASPACALATAAQISTAAGKPMQSMGGADTICVFSAVDDPSFAMAISIYNDQPSMANMKQLETEGSEHVNGLGDDAFWNPTLGAVFVQKGSRAFSFELPSFANLTSNPAAVKSSMVTLATQALSHF